MSGVVLLHDSSWTAGQAPLIIIAHFDRTVKPSCLGIPEQGPVVGLCRPTRRKGPPSPPCPTMLSRLLEKQAFHPSSASSSGSGHRTQRPQPRARRLFLQGTRKELSASKRVTPWCSGIPGIHPPVTAFPSLPLNQAVGTWFAQSHRPAHTSALHWTHLCRDTQRLAKMSSSCTPDQLTSNSSTARAVLPAFMQVIVLHDEGENPVTSVLRAKGTSKPRSPAQIPVTVYYGWI